MQEEKEQSQCSEQTLQKQEEIKELGNMRPKNNIQIVSIIGQIREGTMCWARKPRPQNMSISFPCLQMLNRMKR